MVFWGLCGDMVIWGFFMVVQRCNMVLCSYVMLGGGLLCGALWWSWGLCSDVVMRECFVEVWGCLVVLFCSGVLWWCFIVVWCAVVLQWWFVIVWGALQWCRGALWCCGVLWCGVSVLYGGVGGSVVVWKYLVVVWGALWWYGVHFTDMRCFWRVSHKPRGFHTW